MGLTICVEGVQPQEILHGLLAAQGVFDMAGVTPGRTVTALFIVEGWDISSFVGEVPETERAICTVWDKAD